MVFVGVSGAPASHCGNIGGQPFVTLDTTPVIAEKPYVTIDSSGSYWLQIPQVVTSPTRGVDYSQSSTRSVSFSSVYVSSPSDTAAVLNAKLAQGLHLVLTPGIYSIDTTLLVAFDNQVILGLGMATLLSTASSDPMMLVTATRGVRLSGFIFDASPSSSRSMVMLQWGLTKTPGDPANPSFAHDLFFRVGGFDSIYESPQPKAGTMMVINTGNVIGDHAWLWRADHNAYSETLMHDSYPVDHGLIVNGNDVTMYGLFVEHLLQDLVIWNGEGGRTFFYQSELPYDVAQASPDDSIYNRSTVGYRVAPTVTNHDGYGFGVYQFFRDYPIVVDRAISVPSSLVSRIRSPLSVFLAGQGTILHIINDLGAASRGPPTNAKWYCP